MKINNQTGYTLVELLTVIIILVAVGSIISSVLVSVLRSSNKSSVTDVVRTNGNNAMAQMSKMITYAQKLEGISVDGSKYYADCTSLSSTTKYYYLRIKGFDSGVTTFACANSQIASKSASGAISYLVDPKLYATCYFNCSQESAAAPARIDIFLDLKAASSTTFSENQADIPFETSVTVVNSGNR
jgi:type II secretory pathway pseudopilin PulG